MGIWSRSGKRRIKAKSVQQRRKWHLDIESLESRDLLSGGTWTPVTNLIPDPNGAQTMLLLSDGTVMVQGGQDSVSNSWYALAPDSTGSYVNGGWSNLASMNFGRLFFPAKRGEEWEWNDKYMCTAAAAKMRQHTVHQSVHSCA